MKFCPYCGTKRQSTEEQFCIECGRKYPVLELEEEEIVGSEPPAKENTPAFSLFDSQPEEKDDSVSATQFLRDIRSSLGGEDGEDEPSIEDAPVAATLDIPEASKPEQQAEAIPAAEPQPVQSSAPQDEADKLRRSIDSILSSVTAQEDSALAGEQAGQTATSHRVPPNTARPRRATPAVEPAQASPQRPTQPAPTPAAASAQSAPAAPERPRVLFDQESDNAPAQGTPQREAEKWQKLGGAQNLDSLYEQSQRKAPPSVQLPPPETGRKPAKPKKKKRGPSAGLILTLVVLLVLGVTGGVLGFTYYNNSAGKAIASFIETLEAGDTAELRSSVRVTGATASNEGFAALADAFTSADDRNTLQKQLERQAKGNTSATEAYQAIQLESEPLFLFIKRYYVRVYAVEILAENVVDGATLTLNGTSYTGTANDSGQVYSGILPGRYSYTLTGSTASGETVNRQGEVDAFSRTSVNELGLFATSADVTISNCISDGATIYVNGGEVTARPENGVVRLASLPLNSEIRIEATVDGELRTATVRFADINQTNLSFENYSGGGQDSGNEGTEPEEENDEPDANPAETISADDINKELAVFYQSYLQCINDQSMNAIKQSTSSNNTALADRISTDYNKAYTFEFTSTSISADTIERGENTLKFTATFQYRYTPRDGSGSATAGSNQQTVKMVYQDGEWRVDSITLIS